MSQIKSKCCRCSKWPLSRERGDWGPERATGSSEGDADRRAIEVSEYQSYEFRAIDRPLTQQEMRELRALSTRAQISSTSFVNFYNFGDFRGSPERLMERYFDVFLYYANWGTRRFMLRLPRRLVDIETVSLY